MSDWHKVFKFFVNDLGLPESEVRCHVQKSCSTAPTEYYIQVYGETAISYSSGFFWLPQFIEIQKMENKTLICVIGTVRCQGDWKEEFMKILSDFNKFIRQ
jgi:hypothetical protein